MALKRKKKIAVSAKDDMAHQAYSDASSYGRDADFSQLEQDQQDCENEVETKEPNADSTVVDPVDSGFEDEFHADNRDSEGSLQAEIEDYKQKYLRALADVENVSKRKIKEISELRKYQGEHIFVDMLEIVDNFELALQHAEANPETLRDGVQLIYKMFTDVLSKWEVRAVSGIGEKFDPNKQSAISRVPTDQSEAGVVLNELKKAYFYKDKLIRVGEVVVAAAPTTEDQQARSSESAQVQPEE